MAIWHPPDSAYAAEMRKWEAQATELGPGLRPYIKRDYPMMLHLAGVAPQGGVVIIDTRIVEDADRRVIAEREGFRATPTEAIDALAVQQTEHAKLAAEREWEKRHTMSAKARVEVEAVEEAAGAKHLPTIPEKPKRKYVRKTPRTES